MKQIKHEKVKWQIYINIQSSKCIDYLFSWKRKRFKGHWNIPYKRSTRK